MTVLTPCLQLGDKLGAGPLNFPGGQRGNAVRIEHRGTDIGSCGCPRVDASGKDDFRCSPLMLSYSRNRQA